MDIGYKYISQNFLVFIAMVEAKSTEPGVPCLSCYPYNYSNIYTFYVFVLSLLVGISVPVMQYTNKIFCGSLT